MRLNVFGYSILAGVIALAFSGVGRADLLSNCGTCFGSTYLLTYNPTPVADNGTVKTYDVFLTIDTTGYTGAPTDWVQDVAIKIANEIEPVGASPYNSSLASSPSGTWTVKGGGLNAKGCSGSGSGFLCAQDGSSAVVGSVYTWEFQYATTASLPTGNLAADVKAGYYGINPQTGKVGNTGITSEGIALQTVPDGGVTLMLLGGVLLSVETLRRRFRV
jgi:hypothetical protein